MMTEHRYELVSNRHELFYCGSVPGGRDSEL
jgi:hypothetical protein